MPPYFSWNTEMAALLADATSNTTGSGAAHTGPCTVFVYGTFEGQENVFIEIAPNDVSAEYCLFGPFSVVKGQSAVNVEGRGTYYLRARLTGAGDTTSISVDSTQ